MDGNNPDGTGPPPDGPSRDCVGRADRRAVLRRAGLVGAGALGLGGVRGPVEASQARPEISVDVYHTREVARPDEHVFNAKEALDAMESQLEATVDYADVGRAAGDYSNATTYGDYHRKFYDSNSTRTGVIHLLLYYQPLVAGQALAGHSTGFYRATDSPSCVVNTETRNVHSVRAFKNTVLHELGHPMLDGDNAPETGNEHSFGAQYDQWYGPENSPMLTWYSGNHNPSPARCCNRSDVVRTQLLNGAYSDCTVSEIERWLDEEY